MIARFIIATSLIALSAVPALAVRSGGRIDPSGISEGARSSLTKGFDDEIFSCTIWQSQDGGTKYDYASFTGNTFELSKTLSDLRSWHRRSVWGCRD
jgi:hypothetical protein